MHNLTSRLALGTAQFGLAYGINNKSGQTQLSEVQSILSEAKRCGVDTLDTAAAYGQSEEVLGSTGESNNLISLANCHREPTVPKPL